MLPVNSILITIFFVLNSMASSREHILSAQLSEFIKFKTISQKTTHNYQNEFAKAKKYLKKSFPSPFQNNLVKEFQDSFLFYFPAHSQSSQTLLLNAHYDVVPVDDQESSKWIHPPFSGKLSQAHLWGRGALDDKAAVISLLNALSQDKKRRFNVFLAITGDEEVGGENGAKLITQYLLTQKKKIDAVVDEGLIVIENALNFIEKPIAMIGIAEKGYLSIELQVMEDGGHSSMPSRESAISILSQAITKIYTQQFPTTLTPIISEFLTTLSTEVSFPKNWVFNYPQLFFPLISAQLAKGSQSNALIRTTYASTIFQAGQKDNVIPNIAKATFNFRILPGETIKSTLDTFKTFIDDKRIKVTPFLEQASEPSMVASTKENIYLEMKRSIGKVFPKAIIAPSLMVARTDSYHYQNLTPNIYRFLPMRLDKNDLPRVHGLNERISIKNLNNMFNFYDDFIFL